MKRTLLATLLFLAACRGGSSGDDTGGPDADINTDDVKIQDVQGSMPVDGTAFNIRGVVVTVIDNYGERKGNIFVEEPEGGERSGVLVYGIDLGVVSDLQVGDIVDLEGVVKDEFALTDDTSGRTTTELNPADGGAITVTVIDHGEAPAPEIVDSLAIGLLADQDARDAEWEKWEGVVITLEKVSVLAELDQIGGTPQTPPFEDIKVTGPIAADTSLSSIDAVTRDECLASLTGVGDYFYDWKVLPRSTDDVVHGGTGCPEQEAAADDCADLVDNDADGFSDCADFSCQPLAACVSDTTVADIQNGTVTGNITLSNVFITAITADNKHLYVSDALQGAALNGIYVYRGPTATVLDGTYVLGAQVDVAASVQEFDLPSSTGNKVTELSYATVGAATGSGTTIGAAVTASLVGGNEAAMPGSMDASEPYEGVLVTLTSVKADSHATGNRVTLKDATGIVVMDDDIYGYTQAAAFPDGTCWTITGVMSISLTDDERRFLPRSALDVAVATGCVP